MSSSDTQKRHVKSVLNLVVGESDTIILIHGTFANDAAWVSADSQLAKTLAGKFPAVRIEPFRWSGKNAHSARIKAGEALARRIDLLADGLLPDAGVHLIGHSHGGNVALYALDRCINEGMVKSIACMGTPFLHVDSNSVKTDVRLWTNVALIVAGFIVSMIVAVSLALGMADVLIKFVIPRFGAEDSFARVMTGVFSGVLLLSAVMASDGPRAKLAKTLAERFERAIVRKGEQFALRIGQPVPRQRVFIAFTRGDEARMLLKFGSLAASVPAEVFSILRAILIPVAATSFVCQGALHFIATFVPLTVTDPNSLEAMQDPLNVISMCIRLVEVIVIFPVAILLGNLLFRSHRFSFGWEHPLSAVACGLRARALPDWTTMAAVSIHRTDALTKRGLRHSTFYEDPATIRVLAEWLNGEEVAQPNLQKSSNTARSDSWEKKHLGWFASAIVVVYAVINAAINLRLA